ncbi:MAG: hypothetical protein GTO51_05070 [Candidatus Latescibacteria bacterium]|nr:hypothetical protein [Candidatus Latescibacterota bacterium]NIO28374.1 hypothetical protein [Candidatus Latescibacterota bacterium]NIO55923.1 hypothetical protein [Candidatus Latescibacterota bacterium]NIT01887.1 hypothetical protein [Candidatus Latescibacterota bacterium]
MKTLVKVSMAAVIAFLLISNATATSFGQCPCIVNCPAGDNAVMAPVGGYKTPDLDGNGAVNLVDFAMFAAGFGSPPKPYTFCIDYNCDGLVNLVDFAIFAAHWGHMGPIPGFNQPPVDHYKTYETFGPTITGPIYLRDQFGEEIITFMQMTKFATPVSKNDQAFCDSLAHLTWWEFGYPEPVRQVNVQDQFGFHDLVLGDAIYLLVPALKNPTPADTLPELNHYKCYFAQGETLNVQVRLVDQFDQTTVVVLEPAFFCNPCEKETPDGVKHPIVDPLAHLTVYYVLNTVSYNMEAFVRDQFIEEWIVLYDNLYLCLPTLKNEVIGGPDQ